MVGVAQREQAQQAAAAQRVVDGAKEMTALPVPLGLGRIVALCHLLIYFIPESLRY